jgi:GNAT superfamily N-acetyltransferase
MIIRKATKKDAEIIAENNISLAFETENRRINKITAENGVKEVFSNPRNGFYLLAETNNNIVGQLFITKEWSDWRNAPIWWMHRVYIQKTWRKKGVLTSLLEKLKEMVINKGVYALRLYAFNENHKAIEIYKKLGFTNTPFIILEKNNNI